MSLAPGFQTPSEAERAKQSTAILQKARQIDILNQILPLVLKKDQLNKILDQVEKYRADLKKLDLLEYNELKTLETKYDAALKAAYEKGQVPSRELMVDTANKFKTFSLSRDAVGRGHAMTLVEIVEKELNAGQKKAMMNALTPQLYNPTIDPKEMTETKKIQFFVEIILLDPAAYDVLVKLAANK